MNNFDYKKYLAEGKLLNEVELTDDLVQRVAQAVADEFTAEDNELDLKYVITPNSIEADPRGGGFDLDVNAGPNTPGDDWEDSRGFGIANYLGDYAGGSFVIRPEGDGHLVTNAASRNAKVAYITPEGEIEIISAEDSKADLGMTDDVETDYMERRKEMSDYLEEKQGYNDELDDSLGMKHGSKEQDMAQRRADSENMEKADDNRKYSGDKSKDKNRKKMKKETVDSKLAEIEKQSEIVALEAKIAAVDEMIESKNQRISMVTEDDNLSQLVDKKKMKEMQREVKDLERRKAKMEKLYEKMCGKSYTKEEIVDEEVSTELNENKTKMKKSELKEMIKAAMMAEAEITINDTTDAYDPLYEDTLKEDMSIEDVYNDAKRQVKDIYNIDVPMDVVKQWADNYQFPYSREEDPNDEDNYILVYDFGTEERGDFMEWLKDNGLLEGNLEEKEDMDEGDDMYEAEDVEVEDNENVDVDIEKDVKVDDEESEVDVDVKASMPGESEDVEEVQAMLMKAQQAAAELGDDKLTDQIGNTITYFTRQHVSKVDSNESINESTVRRGTDGLINKLL